MGTGANREYKDSLFRMIFTIPEYTTALYSWLSREELLPGEELVIDDKGGLFTTELKHDVSFRVADKLFFIIEHQSTENENMPIRMLLAIAELYRQYLKRYGHRIYNNGLLSLPAVNPYVFYNGKKEEPLRREMLLSTAFGSNDNGKLELKVTLINVRYDVSAEEMKSCEPLAGYGRFVYEVEKNRKGKGMELSVAIRKAIETCKAEGILEDFLAAHEQEVSGVMFMEYNREDELAAREEKGIEKGIAQGIEKGRGEERISLIRNLINNAKVTVNEAMTMLGIPQDEWAKYGR